MDYELEYTRLKDSCGKTCLTRPMEIRKEGMKQLPENLKNTLQVQPVMKQARVSDFQHTFKSLMTSRSISGQPN